MFSKHLLTACVIHQNKHFHLQIDIFLCKTEIPILSTFLHSFKDLT